MKCTNLAIEKLKALYGSNRLDKEQTQKLEAHLLECNACSEELYDIQPVWATLRGNPGLVLNPESYIRPNGLLWRVLFSKPPMKAVGVAFLAVLAVGMNTQQTRLARLGSVEPGIIQEITMRGAGEKEDRAIYASRYQKGLLYLSQAEVPMVGFVRINQEKLAQSIQHLNEAARLASAMEDQAYLAECYIHLGKAYLMRKDVGQAVKYFEKILSLDQSSAHLFRLKRQAIELMAGAKGLIKQTTKRIEKPHDEPHIT